MTTFKGTVFGEDESLTTEKANRMINDDLVTKEYADKTGLGLLSTEDFNAEAVWFSTEATLTNQSFWVPRSGRMLRWETSKCRINWGTTQAVNRMMMRFYLDGTQVFEQWFYRIGITAGDQYDEPGIKFLINSPTAGYHTAQVRAVLESTNNFTTATGQSFIYDIGSGLSPT